MSVLLAVICLTAQQSPIKHRVPTAASLADKRPVTCEEASQVFGVARTNLNNALKAHLPTTTLEKSSKPISRELVVKEMSSIVQQLKPNIKFVPKAQPYTASSLRMDQPQMDNLKMLIRLGYVGKVSPLATNKADTLSVRQFGEALGFFLSRATELTHQPKAKWSPILGAGSE